MKGKKIVEHTNDWSIVSKRSMIDAGYFEDDFIHLFSSKKRRSPLINLCYYIRAFVVDKVLRHFMCLNTSLYQVISLGAGFDTTFLRLFSTEKNVKYIEIDLPTVVKTKVEILLNSVETKHLFHNWKVESDEEKTHNYYYMSSNNYLIFSQNLDNIDQLEARLKHFGVDFTIPTILLSEVAITYMEEKSCTELCRFLGEKFTNGAMLVYEQINPDDGYGQFMMNHFNMIQSPLKSLTRYNQVKDQSQFYVNHGWKKSSVHRVIDLCEDFISLEELTEKVRLEPFDEWEEFHLTCLHYALYISTNGSMIDVSENFIGKAKQCVDYVEKQLVWSLNEMKQSVERFGHALASLDNDIFIMLGGVGVEKNCHKKTSLFQIIYFKDKEISDIEMRFDQLALIHMACCSLHTENLVCFFAHGGSKSPVREGDSNSFIIQYEHPSSMSLHSVTEREGSPRPCHRWRHTAVSIKTEVFIFGGRTCNLNVLSDFWKIILSSNSGKWSGEWIELDKGPPGRFSHSCISTSDGSIIISGGIDSNFRPLSDIWKWNSSIGWSQYNIDLSIPRYGHTSHLINNKLYLVGGVTFHPSNPGITVINLTDGKMEHYLLPSGSHSNPIMLHNHQSTLSKDQQQIIIIGGGGNCFSFGTSFNRQIITIPICQFIK